MLSIFIISAKANKRFLSLTACQLDYY